MYVLCLGDLWKLLRKFFLKISKRNSLCESVVALYLDFNLFLEMVMQIYRVLQLALKRLWKLDWGDLDWDVSQ